jgi:hypothetical protein
MKKNTCIQNDTDIEHKQALQHELQRALVKLSLRGCIVADDGAAAIFRGLSKNKSLTELDLTNLTLGHFGVKALSAALATNETLTKLSIWGCGLGEERAEHMCHGLASNNGLKEVRVTLSLCILLC